MRAESGRTEWRMRIESRRQGESERIGAIKYGY